MNQRRSTARSPQGAQQQQQDRRHDVIMAALCTRAAIIFLPCGFYLLSIYLFFLT